MKEKEQKYRQCKYVAEASRLLATFSMKMGRMEKLEMAQLFSKDHKYTYQHL